MCGEGCGIVGSVRFSRLVTQVVLKFHSGTCSSIRFCNCC